MAKITSQGLKKLYTDREQLEENRKEILERLSEAREMGDLRENAEYQAARSELSELDKRINEITSIIGSSQVVEDSEIDSSTVGFGTKVKLLYVENNEEKIYTIVGPYESDISLGLLSEESQIAQEMIGKKENSIFSFITPAGQQRTYKVITISKMSSEISDITNETLETEVLNKKVTTKKGSSKEDTNKNDIHQEKSSKTSNTKAKTTVKSSDQKKNEKEKVKNTKTNTNTKSKNT